MWTHGMTDGSAWWIWGLMALATVGFWLVVAYAVREVLGGRARDAAPPTTPSPEPLKLLDARLARGEIGVEEYHRTRQLLTSGH